MFAALLLAVSLSALAASPTPTAAAGPSHFRLVPVAASVYAAIAKPGDRDAVGNAGFVVGDEGVLVVDTFATAAAAEELLAEIRRTTKLPVKWVINSHYHLDHVGGNAVFSRAGASVVAHENVRAWVRTENLKWREEIRPEEKQMLSRLVLPDVTHRQGLTLWLGSRRVEVLFRPGHTGGDSVVRVPDADVVFAGDLFWNSSMPNLIDADTAAWQKTLEDFLDEFPRAAFVPGHGEPGHALDVRFFRDYIFGLRQTVARGLEEGKSGQTLVDSILPLHRGRFGAWAWFDQFAARNITSTEQEMKGTKRYAPTPADRR